MWRVRELLAQGDVDAVTRRSLATRRAGRARCIHSTASFTCNVAAMMAFVDGDFENGEELGRQALEEAEGDNELASGFYGALMMWTWWQRGELAGPERCMLREALAQATGGLSDVRAGSALAHAEAGRPDTALAELDWLSAVGWEAVANAARAFTLALAAAAGGASGRLRPSTRLAIYEQMRPYAGTAVVIGPPACACVGPG